MIDYYEYPIPELVKLCDENGSFYRVFIRAMIFVTPLFCPVTA